MKKTITKLMLGAMLGLGINAMAQGEFITRWSGTTTGQITFKVATSGVVNYAWETVPAGSVGTGTFSGTGAIISGFPVNTPIRLKINPTNFQWFSAYTVNGDAGRLLDVEQWGTTAWTSMLTAFSGCSNLQISATDVPDLSGVTDVTQMFEGCVVLNSPANINSWNMASVTTTKLMFNSAYAFNQPIGGWNTSNLVNMSAMFNGAHSFNQPIGTWNTGRVTDMTNVFSNAWAFNQSINAWNTASVTTTSSMFNGARVFNQSINSWNLTSMTTTAAMFIGAIAYNQDMSGWDVSNITNLYNMFSGATAFNQSLAAWAPHLNPAVSMGRMLNNCGMSIANYDATLIAFNASGPSGRTMDAISLKYCAGASARANLVGAKGWTITGDAQAPGFTTPTFASLGTVCTGFSLPATSGNGIPGTWSPASTSASISTYTFVPATGQCAPTVTLNITVGAPATPAFAVPAPACTGATMAALPLTSTNSITGTWAPALNNAATTNYTFTPDAGQCAGTTTLDIVVNSVATPAFAAPALACAGSTMTALPLVSTNSITGTWQPALNNMVTTNYTFTPDAGQCASTTTVDITVNHTTLPVFTPPVAVCAGSSIAALPLSSNNGITGTWMPAINNTATTNYTFTPDAGQCANTNTLTMIINPASMPTFTTLSVACAAVALPATADNGMTGVWSPSVTTANVATYTFTPDGGQCSAAPTATLALLVNPLPQSTITLTGITLSATETGASYQWLDCNNSNTPIAGATSQSYTPAQSGNYAVVITKSGCTSTSACQQVSFTTGISEVQGSSPEMTVWPNPGQGFFQISTPGNVLGTVMIYNALGAAVYTSQVKESSVSIDLSQLPAGIYVVYTIANQKATSRKLIIGH